MKKINRSLELDVLRGTAVILMVLFHFGFDLAEFGYATYNTTMDIEWKIFRGVILSMFLLAVGMSSYLAYSQGIDKKKLFKNLAKLSLVSLIISVGSYSFFPHAWIYFGVIHFIFISLPLSLLFLHQPKLSLLFGVLLLVAYPLGYLHMDYPYSLAIEYLNIPSFSVDVVSLSPWFGMVLLGIFIMNKDIFNFRISHNKLTQSLSYLGKHSLLIYLIHQPILFAAFHLIGIIK